MPQLKFDRRTMPGEKRDVMRIEHENVEAEVRENGRRIERLEKRLDELARQIAELAARLSTP